MKVYVDDNNCIKAVHTSDDATLTELSINDDANPFNGWSDDRICCYRVNVKDGFVTMMTPYIDSRFIDHFDMGGQSHDENSNAIFELAEYISGIEERLSVLEEG